MGTEISSGHGIPAAAAPTERKYLPPLPIEPFWELLGRAKAWQRRVVPRAAAPVPLRAEVLQPSLGQADGFPSKRSTEPRGVRKWLTLASARC